MENKKCKKCDTELTRKIIKDFDSHNNVVEYSCQRCDYKTTEIEPIGI